MNRYDSECLSYQEARGREQAWIMKYKTLNTLESIANQINGISRSNRKCLEYMISGYNSLGEVYVGGYCNNE